MKKKRPFVFKIVAAEFFSVIHKLPVKERAAYITQLTTDLITLEPVTEYGKQIVEETLENIKKQAAFGKMGGKPKHRHPIGTLKAPLQEPKEKTYPEVKEEVKEKPYKEIIDDLNKKGGYRYQVCESVKKLINARMNEGFVLSDFFTVHTNMVSKWKNDPNMCQYLRPETLYCASKFQGYLNTKIPVPTSGPTGMVY